ncbi:Calpain-B [Orchesella cincta]|uniref:Calpain-B n=1 Tax=Orchesella cincta TaxID=48709 RepID=A0A1D2NGG2_ORCCI|nr:Calpain-B [Orchesella cincta]
MPYKLNSGVLVYRYGERGSGYRLKGAKASVPQDYIKIRASCLQKQDLFEDPEFPADKSSLGPDFHGRPIQWLRPHEFLDDPPQFFVGGASRFDVKQGELGNCWLLAAVANLTLNAKLFHLIVPEDNSYADEKYLGVFHFRFWKFGRWVDVVIDDRLPTRGGRLIFMHSVDKVEMWSALLEKAYAKIHGSYDKLIGGDIVEALEDFTGGLSESCKIEEEQHPALFPLMQKAFSRNSFLGCSIHAEEDEIEADGPLGLVKGHAYSITGIKTVVWDQTAKDKKSQKKKGGGNAQSQSVKLLRIRNPWGDATEWQGAWSDGSDEWNQLNNEILSQFDITFSADGEFWMCYEDFLRYFHQLEICNLGPDVMDELEEAKSLEQGNAPKAIKKRWVMNAYDGSWVKGITAGGCRNFVATYGMNPQFIIKLVDADEEDDDDKCTLIVALMQKNRRKLGKDYLNIGFLIYHIADPDNTPKPLNEKFFKKNRSVAGPPDGYTDAREISCRFKLPPGTYCITPSVFEPHLEGEFILRVFTEQPSDMEENDDEVEIEMERLEQEGMQDATKAATKDSEIEEARLFFKKVAGDDMEVNWEELQGLLDSTFKLELKGFTGFSKDICRSMIAMMDADRSGKLGFDEFQVLWQSVKDWRDVFFKFDEDKSGALSAGELRNALNSAGFRVNNRVLQALVLRYGSKDNSLAFDDFLSCAIKLKAMVEVFKERVPDGEKKALFSLDEWLERALYG